MKRLTIILAVVFFTFCASAEAAHHHGRSLDGVKFRATAISSGSGLRYAVEVVFGGGDATVYLSNGRHMVLALDDDDIEDCRHICCYNHATRSYWTLVVNNDDDDDDDDD